MVGKKTVYLCQEFIFMRRIAASGSRREEKLVLVRLLHVGLILFFSLHLLFQANCICIFFLSWFPLTHYWILELTFQKRWMRNDCIYYLLAKQTKNSTYVTCSHCAMDVNGYIPGLNNFKSWNNFKQQTLDKKTLLSWKLFPSSLNCLYLSVESNID